MAELTEREKVFGRTALVLDKLTEGLAALKSTIQLADDGPLTEDDLAAYQNLAERFDQFLRMGVVDFLTYCVESGITAPDSVEDVL